MPAFLKPLGVPTAITTVNATIYTVPALTVTRLMEMFLSNTTAAAIAVTVFLVPSGGAAAAANEVLPAYSVAGNAALPFTLNTALNAGDFIVVVASAVGVSIRLTGVEMS